MRDWVAPLRRWFERKPAADDVARLRPVVAEAARLIPDLAGYRDHELAARSPAMRNLLSSDEELAAYLAVVGELAARRLGLRPFEVQLLAAAAMLRQTSVEMATGEGKTLVGAIAAAGFALAGRGVHVLSANDYLARRDAEWMGPLFDAFGLNVAAVTGASTADQRRVAYAAPITYLPVTEAGFDVLRDRLVMDPAERVGGERDVAILDEADAVLLDEATIPLVLAADGASPEAGDARTGEVTPQFIAQLEEGRHFTVEDDRRNLDLTEEGLAMIENQFRGVDLFGADHEILTELYLALHAEVLLVRDVDYVLRDGRAWLVSQSRGRIEELQRWPDGLQAAVERKEGLESSSSIEILDQITMSELIGQYGLVVGMSATLMDASEELLSLFGIEVARLPPHRPCVRTDEPHRLFRTGRERDDAAARVIETAHRAGQPVLVSTQSVSMSQEFAGYLREQGLTPVVLNALNDAEEAGIIAEAGMPGRITVSTQMAGRGTDIQLTPESRALGGLLVVGVGLSAAQRLDDQLRGRAGRQGDPGRSVFLVSLEDDLIAETTPGHRRPRLVDGDGVVQDRRLLELPRHIQSVTEGLRGSLRDLTHRYGRLLGLQRGRVLDHREQWLMHDDAVGAVLATDSELSTRLRSCVAEEHLIGSMRTVLVTCLDQAWSEHLALAASVREGIHLRVLANEQPLEQFNRIISESFEPLIEECRVEAMRIISAAPVRDGRLDLDATGLRRPSATWAYAVTDNSLGTGWERATRALTRKIPRPGYY